MPNPKVHEAATGLAFAIEGLLIGLAIGIPATIALIWVAVKLHRKSRADRQTEPFAEQDPSL